MAKIIQMFSNMDEDMKDYNKKIWEHRLKRYSKYVLAGVLLILVVWAMGFYLNNRSFTSYTISSATGRTDTLNTKYESFGGNILKYSRDGVSYTDEKNRLLFSITYTMQSPMLALSSQSGAVADKNGNQIFVFDQKEQQCEIKTLLPIKNLAVSDQGIVAVLMEEANATKLEIYSAEGKLLGDGIFSLEDTGYPMDLSISADGSKIAISFAQVGGSKLGSCVAVYNFESVGENHVDHLVFAQNYDEYILPEVHYFGNSIATAVGDGLLAIYEGNQIPEVAKEIQFDEQIQSVFYGEESIALVFKAEQGWRMEVYDLRGNRLAELTSDLNYKNIRVTDHSIVAYNDTEIGVYNYHGKECFRYTLEEAILDIFTTEYRNRYVLIFADETQAIKLQ